MAVLELLGPFPDKQTTNEQRSVLAQRNLAQGPRHYAAIGCSEIPLGRGSNYVGCW